MATNGRGAWTKTGKDNGSVFYEHLVGKPLDGGSPMKSTAHAAVNLGVRAIQNRLNKEGYTPALTVDGVLGAKSATAIKWYQTKHGMKADGKAGALTCRHMWRAIITEACAAVPGVDPAIIFGQMVHESSGDPGACGYYNEPDRGLVQINTEAHPEISLEQAHDPYYAIPYSVRRFKAAMDKYDGKGKQVQLACAILQHNSPSGADTYYRTGTFGTNAAQDYVQDVLNDATLWEE